MCENKEKVQIDYNEVFRKELELSRAGDITKREAYRMKRAELDRIKETKTDHCSCKEACPHHGKCWECVVIHRGSRDHLPFCMHDMVNERLYSLQLLTEGSIRNYKPHKTSNEEEERT